MAPNPAGEVSSCCIWLQHKFITCNINHIWFRSPLIQLKGLQHSMRNNEYKMYKSPGLSTKKMFFIKNQAMSMQTDKQKWMHCPKNQNYTIISSPCRTTVLNQTEHRTFFKLELILLFFQETTVRQDSNQQSLNSSLNRLNLGLELRSLLYGDRGSNDGAWHPTGPAQGLLGADEHVRDVLVLAEQWQVEDDLQWFSISSHHDELGDASVQGFSGWKRRGGIRC